MTTALPLSTATGLSFTHSSERKSYPPPTLQWHTYIAVSPATGTGFFPPQRGTVVPDNSSDTYRYGHTDISQVLHVVCTGPMRKVIYVRVCNLHQIGLVNPPATIPGRDFNITDGARLHCLGVTLKQFLVFSIAELVNGLRGSIYNK